MILNRTISIETNNEILKMPTIAVFFFFLLILSSLLDSHFQRVIIYLIFRRGSFKRYDYQTEFVRRESDDVSFLKQMINYRDFISWGRRRVRIISRTRLSRQWGMRGFELFAIAILPSWNPSSRDNDEGARA